MCEWVGQTGEWEMRGKTWLWMNDKEVEIGAEAVDCDNPLTNQVVKFQACLRDKTICNFLLLNSNKAKHLRKTLSIHAL